jgi:hypothetical protein
MNNKHLYTMNMEIHNYNTRYNTNLHPPNPNFTKFQKGAYYSGIKIFSHLPANLECLMNDWNVFLLLWEGFLTPFYTLEEFFNYNR